MELFSFAGLHTFYLFIFSIGLGLGIGASVLSHILFLFAGADEKISTDESKLLNISRKVSWGAILMYSFGGLGLFTLAYESMVSLGIFYAGMTVASIMVLNELVFSFRHIPRIQSKRNGNIALDAFVLESGALAAVSWIFLMLHHVLYRTDIGYFAFMALYTTVVAIAMLATWFVRKNSIRPDDVLILKRSLFAALLLTTVFIGAWFAKADQIINPASLGTNILAEITGTMYTTADVALHNNSEDCWLIVDTKVFDVTEASRLHPAMFNCGEDASVNYHKNHGTSIRDKMMQYFIGDLGSGTSVQNIDVSFKKNESLTPYRELYVEEKSWSPRELLFVVEKDAEKLLVIDGTTHTAIGRIHGVGFQPHTSVFSLNAKYMYIISRDGWLTKINIETLEPVTSVNVGENSRGTALTVNNKYVAIGNYTPRNLVLLDAESMKILKTIPLITNMNGKEVESRAGAVVESGNRIVVALKDTNSVWVIDTDKPDFPVTNKFTGIGGNTPTLHDAFITPDGKHYIVASQGSKTAWVLDLETMKSVAEITTGETPHTGPGAAWGDYTYVPALGEGLITVINTKTWNPEKYIKTGGPGLFVRSYSKDPAYPYVWADTAFGDREDEIYIIDARSNEIVKTIIPVAGAGSWHPEFTYDGNFVYVVSQSANEVTVYDAHTFEIVKRIVSDAPSAVSNVGLRIEEPGL